MLRKLICNQGDKFSLNASASVKNHRKGLTSALDHGTEPKHSVLHRTEFSFRPSTGVENEKNNCEFNGCRVYSGTSICR